LETDESAAPVATPGASIEQKRYGAVLNMMMKIGFVILVITFILYLTGMPKPSIPVEDVSANWSLKVDDYLEVTGIEKGWSWTKHLGQSDFLTFAPIAFLSSITVLCYLSIMPILLKRKDYVFCTIAFLEVMILVLAASGLLKTGGH